MVCLKKTMDRKKTYKVVAAILIHDNKILCGKRGAGFFESLWEFPGGKIEEGESKKEALKREIQEELGYEIKDSVFYMTSVVEYSNFIIHMDTYLVNCDRIHLEAYVHKELRWINVSELLEYDWCSADKNVVDKIISDGGMGNLLNKITST